MKTVSSAFAIGACAAFTMIAAPAAAQDEDRQGTVQAKLMGTAVLPDGELLKVIRDDVGLPADSESRVNDNFTPTAAVEYFFTNNISVETIAGVTQHDVDGVGPIDGVELISDVKLIPATVTAKYHFDLSDKIKPYVGAGPAYFIFFDDDVGAGAQTLGITDVDLDNDFGIALQAGVDASLTSDNRLGISLDAKKYFINRTAHFFIDDAEVITTRHEIDPWVLSAGVFYRF